MKRFFLVSFIIATLPLTASAKDLIKSQPITEMTATQNYQYDVSVDLPIYSKVDLSLLKGPKGMRLTQMNQLVWRTDYSDAGKHQVVLQAQDGERKQRQEFTLTVFKKNRSPVIRSQPVKQIAAGEQFFYRVDAVDPDGDAVNIRFARFPQGATYTADSITWQTNYEQAGEYPFRILVSDGESEVEHSFDLQVKKVNRAPVFIEPDSAKLQLEENQFWQLELSVSDPDGDRVELRLQNAPTGMSLAGKTLTWRPSFTQSGDYYIGVVASDGIDEEVLSLHLQVENVNRLPVITSTPVTTVSEEREYTYRVRGYDPDETPLTYELLQGPEGMALQGEYLYWSPRYGEAGKYDVVLQVSDGEATSKQSYTLSVTHVNRKPIIHSEPTVSKIKEGEVFSYTFDVSDPDGDELRIEYDIPKQATRDGNTIYWQTDYDSAGDYTFHIRVSDKASTVEQRFSLSIENVNRKPEFTSKPITEAQEAIYYEYQLQAKDLDGETLTFSLEEFPRGMQIKGGLIMWIPNFDQEGKHNVVATVSDGIDVVKQSFTIHVTNTNREPTIGDVPDQTLKVGERLHYPLQLSDLDGDKVTAHLVHAPKGMSINRKDEIVWKPTKHDIGATDIIVEATDGDLSVRAHFQVEVLE